jgi:RNA polymerase sigma-70 factor (ECF subfamily)
VSVPHTILESRSAPTEEPSNRWFSEEVLPHESKLRHWLRRRFPSLRDLDDIVQEAYLRLVRAKGAGKIRQAKPYLYSTARNAALDLFRHERVVPMERIAEMSESRVLDHGSDVHDSLNRDDELAQLSAAIESLPERCRDVLVLRKLQGLSQKEIAAKLGISENTVAAHASAGMRRCIAYFRAHNLNR